MRRWLVLLSVVAAVGCGDHIGTALSAATAPPPTPIPWTTAAPRMWPVPTLTPVPMPKGVPPCHAHDVRAEQMMGQGAGGWWTGGVRLSATGAPCLVWGYVDVRFKNASGAQIARAAPERVTTLQDWAVLGEARVFWWMYNSCSRDVRIASIEAVLPTDDVPIVIRIDPPMAIGGRCDAPEAPLIFSVAPIAPAPTTPPVVTAPPVTTLAARIDAPATVIAGSRLRYVVTLTNLTTTAVSLDPCPSYLEWLGGHPLPTPSSPPNIGSKPWMPPTMYAGISKASYELNCAVASIGPLAMLSFEMFLDVPNDAVGGDTLSWAFIGGMPNARAPITILPR